MMRSLSAQNGSFWDTLKMAYFPISPNTPKRSRNSYQGSTLSQPLILYIDYGPQNGPFWGVPGIRGLHDMVSFRHHLSKAGTVSLMLFGHSVFTLLFRLFPVLAV